MGISWDIVVTGLVCTCIGLLAGWGIYHGKMKALELEIKALKRSLIVARHEVAKARGKTSSYKSKTKLKESRQCCMEMYRDSRKSSSLSR